MTEDFYVYIHRKGTSCGDIFYVGKGRKGRAWSKHSRSTFWNSTASKYGFFTQIVCTCLSEVAAHTKEKELIMYFGRKNNNTGKLVNLTDGGEGTSGKVYTEHEKKSVSKRNTGSGNPNVDKNIWTFYNFNTEQIIRCTQLSFKSIFPNVNVGNMIHSGSSSLGWIIKEKVSEERLVELKYAKKGDYNSKADKNTYEIINIYTKEVVKGTRVQIVNLGLNLDVRGLVTGRTKLSSGWVMLQTYRSESINDILNYRGKHTSCKIVYRFHHKDGSCFDGTRIEFQRKFNIDIEPIFGKRKRKTVKGWSLVKEEPISQ